MNELIENYEQKIKFTLGYAGTGKSTLLAEEATDKTIVLTPTHKAKEVLQDKGVQNVFTIHSVLKLVPTIDMNFRKKGKLQKLRKIGAVDLAEIDTVIIDEFSMIPTHILDLLMSLLPSTSTVSIYGDPYQLPPVEGDPVDPYWYTAEENIVTLTTQHRSEAPEVVETFTRFVHYLESESPSIDLRLNSAIKSGSLKGFNPDTDRALAFTNAETIAINDRIAKVLNLPKEISIGETVSINGVMGTLVDTLPVGQDHSIAIYPACIAKGKLLVGNKLAEKTKKIEHDMNKFRQKIINGTEYFIEIDGVVYSFYGDIEHYANDKTYHEEVENTQLSLICENNLDDDEDIKDWCKNNRDKPLVRERGKAWSTYLGHKNLVFDLRRPFCTTVHKSQGSEFDTIYLAQDDIKKAIRGGNYVQYARLMYVALSRAIHKVVII